MHLRVYKSKSNVWVWSDIFGVCVYMGGFLPAECFSTKHDGNCGYVLIAAS